MEGVGEQTGREGPVQAPGGAFWLRREPSREEGGRPLLEAPSSLRGRCRRGNRSGSALTSPSAKRALCFGADAAGDAESAQARPTRVSVAVAGTQGSPAGWHRAGGGTRSHWARREERLAGHRGPGHRCTSLRAARRTANRACAHAGASPRAAGASPRQRPQARPRPCRPRRASGHVASPPWDVGTDRTGPYPTILADASSPVVLWEGACAGGLHVLVPRTDRQMGPGPRSTHRGEARQTGNADALCPRPRRRLAGARRPRRGQADMRGVCVQWPVYPNTTGPSQLRARTAAPESSGEHLISFAAAFLEGSPCTKEMTHTGQMPVVKEKNAGLGTRRRSGAV